MGAVIMGGCVCVSDGGSGKCMVTMCFASGFKKKSVFNNMVHISYVFFR